MTSQRSFIATPLRATMPGRISTEDRLNRQSCNSVNKRETSKSNVQSETRISSNSMSLPADQTVMSPPCGVEYKPDVRRLPSADSVFTDISVSQSSLVAPRHNPVLPGDVVLFHVDSADDNSYCCVINNESSTSAQPESSSADLKEAGSYSPRERDSGRVESGEVRTKIMKEKEYVHVQHVSYFEETRKKNDSVSHVIDDSNVPRDVIQHDKKRTFSPFRTSKNIHNSSTAVNTNNNGGNTSEPNTPAKDRSKVGCDDPLRPAGERKVRSTTLPSDILSRGDVVSPTSVKKASKKKSKSITSFFQVSIFS